MSDNANPFEGVIEFPKIEQEPIARRFTFRPSEEMAPRPWVYHGLLLRQYLTVTVAPGGVGKTTLSMHEAIAVALNKPIMDVRPVETGPVLLFNGEDPYSEIELRLAALIEHHGPKHGFTGQDLEKVLHVQSGRDSDAFIITTTLEGGAVTVPEKRDEIVRYCRRYEIKLIVVDPFISVHEVNENDNVAINRAASDWVSIAAQADCAVHLIHHSKKTNGGEVTDESSRGGKALVDKARVNRVLQPMSASEAEAFGVELRDRFQYVRINDGKVNLHKRSGEPSWMRLVGVPLGNGEEVQSCEPWHPPGAFTGVTVEHLIAVQNAVRGAFDRGEPARKSSQAKQGYIGAIVADVMGWDLAAEKGRIERLVATWIGNGALKEGSWHDAKKVRDVPIIEVGNRATGYGDDD